MLKTVLNVLQMLKSVRSVCKGLIQMEIQLVMLLLVLVVKFLVEKSANALEKLTLIQINVRIALRIVFNALHLHAQNAITCSILQVIHVLHA